MPRLSGQVTPYLPSSAPMTLTLPQEVYALDGLGRITIGRDDPSRWSPRIAIPKYHRRRVPLRRWRGRRRGLGAISDSKKMLIAAGIAGAVALLWLMKKKG